MNGPVWRREGPPRLWGIEAHGHYSYRVGAISRRKSSLCLEWFAVIRDNRIMPNETTRSTDTMADLKEVARQAMSGGLLDPALVQRVKKRAQEARDQVRQQFGLQEIGVEIIRQMRDAR
jgi:hypothetical protein